MSSAENKGGAVRPLLIVFATIGGLALLTFLLFFALVFSLVLKSGVAPQALGKGSGSGVGVITIEGVIADPSKILKDLRRFRQDPDIKAIVLRIDSPGGAVGASQEIFAEVRKTDEVKPVVASLVNTAASGAFYAACGARWIVSNPGTVTGSIGVIMKLPNISGLLDKLGIRTTVIKSGRLKDLASITRDLSPEERQVIQGVMDDIHHQFIEDVAQGRHLEFEQVSKLADGRIFSGRQAKELRLVDQLGNFSAAVDKAGELAGIEGQPRLVYPERDKFTAIKEILEESGARSLMRFFGLFMEERAQIPY